MSLLQTVLEYHQQTKHHLDQMAKSLGYLDWAVQPDPFRVYSGATTIKLPISTDKKTAPYDQLFHHREIHSQPVNLGTISEFLYQSLAISAWKTDGSAKWALRVNPSSGNLHPTEGYLLLPPLPETNNLATLGHYSPQQHELEIRRSFNPEVWQKLIMVLPKNSFFVGLSNIYWREAWKYGERAYRYCQLDVGHALAALRLAASLLGWRFYLLANVDPRLMEKLFGLDQVTDQPAEEGETFEAVAVVIPQPHRPADQFRLSTTACDRIVQKKLDGQANHLSQHHHHWEVIDRVSEACRYVPYESRHIEWENFPGQAVRPFPPKLINDTLSPLTAGEVIRQRRSVRRMNPSVNMSRTRFFTLLSRLIPDLTVDPWDAIPWRPRVYLGLLVHRVEGIDAGLYMLVRDTWALDTLKEKTNSEYLWKKPPACPIMLPLYLLQSGDYQKTARQLACDQEIAGDGAFTVIMLAEFDAALNYFGATFYRNLFWECGLIGQVLYLEAEAKGFNGTGIGCFFDDETHRLFGLKGTDFQCLYQFTVGKAVNDDRITTLPAYDGEL